MTAYLALWLAAIRQACGNSMARIIESGGQMPHVLRVEAKVDLLRTAPLEKAGKSRLV
ncbi:hypothetical protein [Rhodovulum sulfidophilum]|uniref:hypothetical protein n=1 Tax=Rhodovulum sulfidophilum TaxID=35806 RepID=UPI0019211204|nr:hypothetical protein [Rhodovulum sulfidophilum]